MLPMLDEDYVSTTIQRVLAGKQDRAIARLADGLRCARSDARSAIIAVCDERRAQASMALDAAVQRDAAISAYAACAIRRERHAIASALTRSRTNCRVMVPRLRLGRLAYRWRSAPLASQSDDIVQQVQAWVEESLQQHAGPLQAYRAHNAWRDDLYGDESAASWWFVVRTRAHKGGLVARYRTRRAALMCAVRYRRENAQTPCAYPACRCVAVVPARVWDALLSAPARGHYATPWRGRNR
jgi:hypothetical protein